MQKQLGSKQASIREAGPYVSAPGSAVLLFSRSTDSLSSHPGDLSILPQAPGLTSASRAFYCPSKGQWGCTIFLSCL